MSSTKKSLQKRRSVTSLAESRYSSAIKTLHLDSKFSRALDELRHQYAGRVPGLETYEDALQAVMEIRYPHNS
ncbi:hypothetical protein IJJ08_05080 [bacterium]|nr:hypothetical protein [bacterium]